MSHTHFCHISKINSDKKKKTPPFLSPSPPLSGGTPPPSEYAQVTRMLGNGRLEVFFFF